MQMKKKIKEEKGSMAVYVTVVLLTFLVVITMLHSYTASIRKSQLKTIGSIKKAYEIGYEDVEGIYQEQVGKLEKEVVEIASSVTDTKILTLDNAVGTPLKDYKIYGNSIQESEPSIETPVEIKSVGELVTEESDANYGKYKIPIVVSNGEGESTTTNIYLDEPLRSITNLSTGEQYADYIDFANKLLVRKTYKEVIDTVGYISSKATTYKIFLTDIEKKPLLTGATTVQYKGYTMSNKFKQSNSIYSDLGLNASNSNIIQTYMTTTGINRVAYTFGDTTITTIAQAQEKIGDGFEIIYALAEKIETEIELPEIAIYEGTTTIEVDTTVPSSKIDITYEGYEE